MLKGALSTRHFLSSPQALYGFRRELTLMQPYRPFTNSGPPLKTKNIPPTPSISLNLEGIAAQEKEKLKQDMLSMRKSKFMSWKDFSELTKFKLSLLNTWVAATAYFMTNKCIYADISQVGLFLLASQLSAMSSQAMNQSIEVEHDKKMKRTCHRPLPSGRVSVSTATKLSWGLLGSANILLYSMFGWQAGAVANAIFSSYILIYTPMKRTSEMNTTWGSAVGAAVPYLGWFAGGGSALSFTPFLLCLFMFAWQYPHFYGILWTYKDDYKRGGYKMLDDPVKAARHAKLAVAGYLASVIGLIATGDISIYSSIPAGYAFWKYGWKPAVEFEKNPTLENAKKMKYGSYWPFTVFTVAVILGILQRVYMHKYHADLVAPSEGENKVEEEKQENKEEKATSVAAL